MATVLLQYKGVILLVFILVTYFLWMDVALYYHILAMKTTKIESSPTTESHPKLYSPFSELSVKAMMMDQMNHYVHIPSADIFNQITHFADIFYFVTPNMVSFFHALVAIVAAKFISSEVLLMRRVGVVLFEFRNFLDALDGVVSRARTHKSNVPQTGSNGYYIDGLTDMIGSVALIVGCYFFLRRSFSRKNTHLYTLLPTWTKDESEDSATKPVNGIVTSRRVMGILVCYALQLLISSFFWNRYISGYYELLSNPHANQHQSDMQLEVLKSSMMWIIIWFWRIINPHSILELTLFFIYFDKLWEFLVWIQFIGFCPLASLIFLSELHFKQVSNYIGSFDLLPAKSLAM